MVEKKAPLLTPLMRWFLFAMILANIAGTMTNLLTPLLSGRIADRYGERVSISGGFLIMFFAYVVFLRVRGYPGFVVTWALFGAGVGLLSPAYQSLISKVVPRQSLGAFSGLFQSSLGFISLPAPWIGAQLWEHFNPRLPFLITAVVLLASIVITWQKFKLPAAQQVETAPAAP